MVAQVAADEPDTAANTPQPTTFTCSRRPGSQLSQGASPRNICSERRVRKRISPIQMKSGSAASDQEAELDQTVVASTGPMGTDVTIKMAAKPTMSSAMPIQMPKARRPMSKPKRMTAVVTRPRSGNIV